MDANSRITFDSYFEDTLTDSVGKVASYANLSGAEKKAVDLACMFSFMEMRELQNFPVFNFVNTLFLCSILRQKQNENGM